MLCPRIHIINLCVYMTFIIIVKAIGRNRGPMRIAICRPTYICKYTHMQIHTIYICGVHLHIYIYNVYAYTCMHVYN